MDAFMSVQNVVKLFSLQVLHLVFHMHEGNHFPLFLSCERYILYIKALQKELHAANQKVERCIQIITA